MVAKKKESNNLKRPLKNETVEALPKKKKFSLPSVEQLSVLHEGAKSIKSLFSLQTEELLKNTEIKKKLKDEFLLWLEQFEKLNNADEIFKQSENSKLFRRISKQLSGLICCDQDLAINFEKPQNIGIFGLYKINCLPGPNIEANIYVTIPKKCFNVKDYLNNRYFSKKYYYLMYLAEYLKYQNLCSSIKFSYYNENPLLPYLILSPSNVQRTSVKLFLVPEENYFKKTRYNPEANNVKAQIFEKDFGNIDKLEEMPTTFYNSALAFDSTLVENSKFIEHLISSTSLQEGIVLIIIWIKQRGLSQSGIFSTDLALYFIAYLISKGTVTKIMTSQQVFKNFLYFIHTTNLTKLPLTLCDNLTEAELQKYKNAFDIVLMDKTGFYNAASFLTINDYLKMRYESKLALDLLEQSDCFPNLFLTKIPSFLQYDIIIKVEHENDYEALLKSVSQQEKAKYVGDKMSLVVNTLLGFLNKGLSNRVLNIVPIKYHKTEWNYGVMCQNPSREIIFGINLQSELAYEIMEFGPALNDPEEKDFREFWGKLSSNRRFRDGTAKVAVYFETKTIKERRDIIKTIINYVMGEKLGLKYKYTYSAFEDVLLNKNIETWYPSGTNEETTLKIIKSSDDLGHKIRSLNMELGVTGIGAISDVFCYTNVFPPIPSAYSCHKKVTMLIGNNIVLKNKSLIACPRYVEPIECVIQLAHSSKWPSTLNELRQKKVQFLMLISSLMKSQHNIVSTVEPPYLHVVHEGIVFRYHLYLSKEIALLKRNETSGTLKEDKEIDMALELEKKLLVVPKIIGALKGLSAQFPSYAVSSCMAKRWIRSQLIDEFLLPDMVIDLLNAHQFIHKSLYEPAVSPQNAFLRFIKFLVEVQWNWQPVVINFNNVLSADRISELEKEMDVNREKYPPLFIVTPYDDCNSLFSKKAPCKEVLMRLKILANEFLKFFEQIILEDALYQWQGLFTPNTEGFDCILHMKLLLNPRRHEELSIVNPSKVVYKKPENQEVYFPVLKFNPVEMYLEKLRETFGDLCVFFHDTYGGNYIGVLWKPDAAALKDYIIKGFKIFGKEVLKSIEMKNS